MTFKYHYEVPGIVIWISHIIIGLFLIYTGYLISANKKERLTNLYGIVIIILGVLPILYHTHLMLFAKEDNTK
jgi:membrane protein DedA with SNARE-associated domain